MQANKALLFLTRLSCVLAFFVITVGAYTRLSDAGLGCPDWPGCYGHIIVPAADQLEQANRAYPARPVEPEKARVEMAHRYIAGILGLLILAITFITWRKTDSQACRLLAGSILLLVIFQALLGMWTITLLLKPLIVMSHLMGGMTIISLLYWFMLRQQAMERSHPSPPQTRLHIFAIIGLLLLVAQIALGGWTSANYAALACPDFPTCHGVAWPAMDFKEAFVPWRGAGIDYEGGVLDGAARTAIHVTHRIGAIIVFIALFSLVIYTLKGNRNLRMTAFVTLLFLISQVALGIANVMLHLPLPIAVAHNGVAALLLLSLVTLVHQTRQ